MADHAAHIVDVVQRLEGIALDYTVESLESIDALLGRFHDAGDYPDRTFATLFQFGAYIGEVLVRNRNGKWVVVPDDHPLGAVGGSWPLVELATGHVLNPVGKAVKRVKNGPEDSIPHFAQALAPKYLRLPADSVV